MQENDLLIRAFDKDNVEAIVTGGLSKTISKTSLMAFKEPSFRADLIRKIVMGEYKIEPPRVCSIPKDDGGFREIYVNSDIDRLLLALANRAYVQIYGKVLSPACMAYLPGCSTSRAVRDLASHSWTGGYKLDISKYFDSVSREALKSAFAELDTGSPLDRVVYDYYMDDRIIRDGIETTHYKSLAQGCAVSTFLANYILRHIDMKMTETCSYYARYSDDIVIFNGNIELLSSMLADIGLRLNPSKIEELSPDKEFTFLGYGIRGRDILVSQKHFAKIKREVKHACKISRTRNLSSVIKRVQRVLISFDDPLYSWIYRQACVTDIGRVAELDRYCKDCIRAAVTGSWNYTHNIRAIPNSRLETEGWVSLVHLLKCAKMSRALFFEEVRGLL